MAHVEIAREDIELDSPVLIEGLPGVGLVGKLATDHVVDSFGMAYYGHIGCPGLPRVAIYHEHERAVLPPVRLYADEERDLLALQSEVPVSPTEVSDFAECVTGLLESENALPLYFTGLGTGVEGTDERQLFGIATGEGDAILVEQGIDPPAETGVWSGPTGALLHRAEMVGQEAIGIIVESDPQFPDPEAACVLLEEVVNPVADVEIDVSALRERVAEIREQRKQFAQQMSETTEDHSSRADPFRMFQ